MSKFIVLAAIGLVIFLLISSTLPFKNSTLSTIFPKKQSFAIQENKGFGVNDHLMWEGTAAAQLDLDRMKQDGIMTVRFDLDWVWLEPNQKGSFDQSYLGQFDSVIAMLRARGMNSIVTFLQPPAWARRSECVSNSLCPPTNNKDYADTFGFLAKRMQGKNVV